MKINSTYVLYTSSTLPNSDSISLRLCLSLWINLLLRYLLWRGLSKKTPSRTHFVKLLIRLNLVSAYQKHIQCANCRLIGSAYKKYIQCAIVDSSWVYVCCLYNMDIVYQILVAAEKGKLLEWSRIVRSCTSIRQRQNHREHLVFNCIVVSNQMFQLLFAYDYAFNVFPSLNKQTTVYREFFGSGNFGENDAWNVC